MISILVLSAKWFKWCLIFKHSSLEGNPVSFVYDGSGLKTLLTKKLKKIVNLQKRIEVKLIDESYTSGTHSCDKGTGVTKTSKGKGRKDLSNFLTNL